MTSRYAGPMLRSSSLRRHLALAPLLLAMSLAGSCYDVHGIGGGSPDGGGGIGVCRGARGVFVEADYAWQDITRRGERLRSLNTDDASEDIDLGFSFPFFGESYRRAAVSTNGFVQLGRADTATAFDNVGIPSTRAPDTLVAPLWDDLDLGSGGAVYFDTDGRSPDRRAIVTWDDVAFLGDGGRSTFQAVLHESGVIEMQYRSLASSSRGAGADATVGVEAEGGLDGEQYSFGRAVLEERTNLTYCP